MLKILIMVLLSFINKNDGTYKSGRTLYSYWLPHVNSSTRMWDDGTVLGGQSMAPEKSKSSRFV